MFAIFIHSDVHFCLRTHPTKGENAYATQHRKNDPNIISIHFYLVTYFHSIFKSKKIKEISFIFVKVLIKLKEGFHIPICEYI